MQTSIDYKIGEGEIKIDGKKIRYVHLRKVPLCSGKFAFMFLTSKPGRGALRQPNITFKETR